MNLNILKRVNWSLLKAPGFLISVGLSLPLAIGYVGSRPGINLLPVPDILEVIEAKTLDLRFLLRGQSAPHRDIVIVAVDEKTEDELGRWQSMGRKWLAALLDRLHEAQTTAIGFDLVLAEPDKGKELTMVEEIRGLFLEHFPEELPASTNMLKDFDMIHAAHDYDHQLAESIHRAGNVVLGIRHFWDPESAAHLTPEKEAANRQLINRVAYTIILGESGATAEQLPLAHSLGVELNLPAFSEAAVSFGHFDTFRDRDGNVRFTHLLVEYDGQYYPSLALEVARTYLNPPSSPIIYTQGSGEEQVMDALGLGDMEIPVDEEGRLFINYYGPSNTFPYYSLVDVITGTVPHSAFAGKIVLVGFTSMTSQDLHSVTFEKNTYPGVEINATIIENIIQNSFLTRPKGLILYEVCLILLIGFVPRLVIFRKSPLIELTLALGCLLVVAALAYGLFLFAKVWMNVTFPALFIIVNYVCISSYKYFTEERQKRMIKDVFQHYVSPKVVTHLLEAPEKLNLGGERKQLTAFFSDIRRFTTISEQMEPHQLVDFLNEYMTEMTQIVLKYDGTVDKYMGDAIMAVYGTPIDQDDHAVRACKTAVDMIIRLKELHVGWAARGISLINIGIGINSGEMIVGNMGSHERFDYTVMGDNVNLASRLEGANKQYGTNIIISQFTYYLCMQHGGESWTVRELDCVRVKGKQEPVTIYELVGYGVLYGQKQPLIAKFTEGLEAYKQRQWVQAIALFQEALQIDSEDRPSKMYIERCTEYLHTPPPDDWDGVFEMKTT